MRHNFRNLEIWKKSRKLVKKIYVATRDFPEEERFGLTSQLRRAAVSVPSNIAEGCGRNGNKELIQFCHIATGSLCEIETQLLLSEDLDFLPVETSTPLIDEITEIRKMLSGFTNKLKNA